MIQTGITLICLIFVVVVWHQFNEYKAETQSQINTLQESLSASQEFARQKVKDCENLAVSLRESKALALELEEDCQIIDDNYQLASMRLKKYTSRKRDTKGRYK